MCMVWRMIEKDGVKKKVSTRSQTVRIKNYKIAAGKANIFKERKRIMKMI